MKTNNQHSIDFAFVLLLFCLLTMCSLTIVYIGSQVYSATVKTMEDHYSMTTANDYILEKTRQNLAKDQIEVRTIDDIDVLCLHETNDQSLYTTYIYVYQGQLRELLIPDHIAFAKENGEAIMAAQDLQLNIQNEMLAITLTINSKTQTSYIALWGGLS